MNKTQHLQKNLTLSALKYKNPKFNTILNLLQVTAAARKQLRKLSGKKKKINKSKKIPKLNHACTETYPNVGFVCYRTSQKNRETL